MFPCKRVYFFTRRSEKKSKTRHFAIFLNLGVLAKEFPLKGRHGGAFIESASFSYTVDVSITNNVWCDCGLFGFQSYIVCELHEKIDVLWSFLRNHLKHKVLVFMTSCKQVRLMMTSGFCVFVYDELEAVMFNDVW